jgi:hypothetical protein
MNSMKRINAAVLVFVLALGGCMGSARAPILNRDITTGIADAGSVANNAEKLYEAGSIKQTAGNRQLINGLGNAYNLAKASWLAVLNAEAAYNGAQTNQITACAPAAPPTGCTTATAAATAARVQLSTAQIDMNTKVAAMASQTAAVQALASAK